MSNKLYHIIIRRQSPDEPLADALADKAVEAHRPAIEGVGGTISASHTFQVAHSYIVVSLPDDQDIDQLIPGCEVREWKDA